MSVIFNFDQLPRWEGGLYGQNLLTGQMLFLYTPTEQYVNPFRQEIVTLQAAAPLEIMPPIYSGTYLPAPPVDPHPQPPADVSESGSFGLLVAAAIFFFFALRIMDWHDRFHSE